MEGRFVSLLLIQFNVKETKNERSELNEKEWWKEWSVTLERSKLIPAFVCV